MDIVNKRTILVVDDEQRLTNLVSAYLTQEGFKVVTAENGEVALEMVEKAQPDLVILDIMMPVMDGFEFLAEFRKKHTTPVICLTAKVQEEDQLKGFNMGTDDYVTKPFRPRTLMARVHAVLQRAGHSKPIADTLFAADIVLDRENRFVKVGERYIDLTPSEFDILAGLMSAPGKV
ncbi:MAG: response regulator transcription factor, partial [Anaerolineaceae bacterium]|nr:response regulator transcription factor [Anaerolineaceae bacterium]